MTTSEPSPVRPLLVRFGALGDLITLTACAESLRRRWGARCDLITGGAGARRVFAGLGTLGEVVTLASRRTPYLLSPGQRRLVRWLRRRPRGPVYLFEDKLEVADKLAWLLARGGFGPEHVVGPREVPRGDLEHFQPYGERLAAATPRAWQGAGGRPPRGEFEPRLTISDEERGDCRRWLAGLGIQGLPLVLLQPHSRRSNRGRWPDERWALVARTVLQELPDSRVLVLGSPAEARQAAALAAEIGDRRALGVASGLPLRRLFALLEVAHSLISLDTGPAHAAAALGCPVVVLVGMADPRRNRPVGPVGRIVTLTAWPPDAWPPTRREWEATHEVTGIPVEAVIAAWRGLERREASAL